MSLIGELVGGSSSGGSGGSAVWGGITGTLSNQTDLNNALNEKNLKVQVKIPEDYSTVKDAITAGEDNIYIAANITESSAISADNMIIEISSNATWTLGGGTNTFNESIVFGAKTSTIIVNNIYFNYGHFSNLQINATGTNPSFDSENSIINNIKYVGVGTSEYADNSFTNCQINNANFTGNTAPDPLNANQFAFYYCKVNNLVTSLSTTSTTYDTAFYFYNCDLMNFANSGTNVQNSFQSSNVFVSVITKDILISTNNKYLQCTLESTTATFGGGDYFEYCSFGSSAVYPTSNYKAINCSGGIVNNFNSLGTKTIGVDLYAGIEPATSPASKFLTKGANNIIATGAKFVNASQTNIQFSLPMPKSWNAGTINYDVVWLDLAKSGGNVVFGLQAAAVSADDNIDISFGTAVEVSQTVTSSTNNIQYVTAKSNDLTINGTPAKEDVVYFNFYRKYDTNSPVGDALACYVRLYVTVDNANDN